MILFRFVKNLNLSQNKQFFFVVMYLKFKNQSSLKTPSCIREMKESLLYLNKRKKQKLQRENKQTNRFDNYQSLTPSYPRTEYTISYFSK